MHLTNPSTPKTLVLSVAGRKEIRPRGRLLTGGRQEEGAALEPKTLRVKLKDQSQEGTMLFWGEMSLSKLGKSGAKVDMGSRRGHR